MAASPLIWSVNYCQQHLSIVARITQLDLFSLLLDVQQFRLYMPYGKGENPMWRPAVILNSQTGNRFYSIPVLICNANFISSVFNVQ